MSTPKQFGNWNTDYDYNQVQAKNGGRASECVQCGRCERACPQHLPIRSLLKNVAQAFER